LNPVGAPRATLALAEGQRAQAPTLTGTLRFDSPALRIDALAVVGHIGR
jgi:hypothetical protein